MNDRELLELAAKAAGLRIAFSEAEECLILGPGDNGRERYESIWNPLTDDGDALRLAVKLQMNIDIGTRFTEASVIQCDIRIGAEEYCEDDPYAAARRAIVRCAAEIGKAMP